MVSEKQRKARENFIKNWAGKKRVTKTGKSKRMSKVRKVLRGSKPVKQVGKTNLKKLQKRIEALEKLIPTLPHDPTLRGTKAQAQYDLYKIKKNKK